MTKVTRRSSNQPGAAIAESPRARSTDRAAIREDAPEDTDSDLLIGASWGTPVKVLKTSEHADDSVRLYLREIGSVDLLSREGEVAIAKRIEAGRRAMIDGLCESPLTFQAIATWRNELSDGRIFLRDIIDLEARYASLGEADPTDDRARRGVYPPGADGPTCSTGQPEAGALGESNLDDDEFERGLRAVLPKAARRRHRPFRPWRETREPRNLRADAARLARGLGSNPRCWTPSRPHRVTS
jgi:Sigma-70 factor, region 1.2